MPGEGRGRSFNLVYGSLTCAHCPYALAFPAPRMACAALDHLLIYFVAAAFILAYRPACTGCHMPPAPHPQACMMRSDASALRQRLEALEGARAGGGAAAAAAGGAGAGVAAGEGGDDMIEDSDLTEMADDEEGPGEEVQQAPAPGGQQQQQPHGKVGCDRGWTAPQCVGQAPRVSVRTAGLVVALSWCGSACGSPCRPRHGWHPCTAAAPASLF